VLYLTRHQSANGPRWALDGRALPATFDLHGLLRMPAADIPALLRQNTGTEPAAGPLLAPIETTGEVWAAGVTYLRSREAREAESTVKDVYSKVYDAARPELFFKASGWRVAGHRMPIRIRRDSRWNVPEPELTLVINASGEIVGFCAGNDVSSRDIEGENPLYLPQAKIYDGSCALGPGISLCDADTLRDLDIDLVVTRGGRPIFTGATRTAQIKRALQELVEYLRKELAFPDGVFLMTGTGIVPPDDFSLERGDLVRITIGGRTLENEVGA
jgi:2-dehydro-3-deoxy-D-arabinonate dehydratase